MPKISLHPQRGQCDGIEASLKAWDEFEHRASWKRSSRGNLWREWSERVVTVFVSGRRFRWSITHRDDNSVEFSQATYGDEKEAIIALGEALELNELT